MVDKKYIDTHTVHMYGMYILIPITWYILKNTKITESYSVSKVVCFK